MQRKTLFSLFLLNICAFLSLNAQTNLFSDPILAHASYSFIVEDISSGKRITEINPNLSLTPASVMKLHSTASAVKLLDLDSRLETKLAYHGTISEDGILLGDLIIYGTGDPSLGAPDAEGNDPIVEWTRAVKELGISRISGKIIADLSIMERDYIPGNWEWSDLGNYYAPSFSALNYLENTYKVVLESEGIGDPVVVRGTKPKYIDINFTSFAKGSPSTADNAYIQGAGSAKTRTIVGTIPAQQVGFSIKGSIPSPPTTLLKEFRRSLNLNNIAIDEIEILHHSMGDSKVIAFHQSPTIKELVQKCNTESNNLYAVALRWHALRSLSKSDARSFNYSPLMAYWDKILPFELSQGTRIDDGAGVGRSNLLTANYVAALLKEMSSNRDFLATLPIAGKSGTLRSFLKGTRLEGKVFAKSGTSTGVKCYAGYVDYKGSMHTFVIMLENHLGSSSQAKKAIERIILSAFPA